MKLRHGDELSKHVAEKEAQPNALAPALHADQVHAVVPIARTHQRQAPLAEAQSVSDGTHAMLVQACRLGRSAG